MLEIFFIGISAGFSVNCRLEIPEKEEIRIEIAKAIENLHRSISIDIRAITIENYLTEPKSLPTHIWQQLIKSG